MTNDLPPLKPCPFCAGRTRFRIVAKESSCDSVGYSYRIECSKCGMSNSKCLGRIMVLLHPDGELAIAEDDRSRSAGEWNRRAKDG